MQYWSETLQRKVDIRCLVDGLTEKFVAGLCPGGFTLTHRQYPSSTSRGCEHVTLTALLEIHGSASICTFACAFQIGVNTWGRRWVVVGPIINPHLEGKIREIGKRHKNHVPSPPRQRPRSTALAS